MSPFDITQATFSARQAGELTQATAQQIVHWDAKGLVKPSIRPAAGRGSRRLYSYTDLLALKTVKSLRDQGVSLQRIRKCVLYLRRQLPHVPRPLDFCTLLTDGQTVYLLEDEDALIDTVRGQGQHAMLQVSIAALDRDLRDRTVKLTAKRVEPVAVGRETYQVEIEPDQDCGGYVAEVAGLPGCITDGETLEEVIANASDAIEVYLAARTELAGEGIDVPIGESPRRRKA